MRTTRRSPLHGSRRRILTAAAALLLLGRPAARAGDYHTGSTLLCNQCHVMHYSQRHGYQLGRGGGFVPLGGGGPRNALLRNRVNDLCLACHDTGLATDVLGATNSGTQAGSVRLAGYLGRLGTTGAGNGHTLDALDPAPGSQPLWSPQDENGAGLGLTCTNCHSPHGATGSAFHPTGNQYRNLRSDPGNATGRWVTYNHETPGVNDLSRDVFVRRALAYDESEVDWNEPDSQVSAIARWCGGCHSFAHDNELDPGAGNAPEWTGFLREHPVEDEDFGNDEADQYNSHTNRVKVMSEIGLWSPADRDATPTCITCHRAHGNGNPDGLIYRSGTGVPTEDGDGGGSTLEHLCMQCHVEGTAFD